MKKLYVIKVGGNIIDDREKLKNFLRDFAGIMEKKILVHGGGKLATELAGRLNIPQQMVEGRRITDRDTLDVALMVYGGLINKKIVAALQAEGCNAIGLTGADAKIILSHKRSHPSIDYGFVGDIDEVNQQALNILIEHDLTLF